MTKRAPLWAFRQESDAGCSDSRCPSRLSGAAGLLLAGWMRCTLVLIHFPLTLYSVLSVTLPGLYRAFISQEGQKADCEKGVVESKSVKIPDASCRVSSVPCAPSFPFAGRFPVQDRSDVMRLKVLTVPCARRPRCQWVYVSLCRWGGC